MSVDVQGLLSNLPKWSKFFEGLSLPPTVNEGSAIAELKQRLGNIRRRLRDGPDAPLRIAFFGPTGAGKSKLFGSLIRDNFSGSGFKRPFTRESFYYVHDDWKSLVAALEGEVSLHHDPDWHDIVLIDTPDFDSVEEKNRAEAERVFLECDGFLFVTDALKYADASTWDYLTRIYDAGKGFAVILNKVKSATVSESFRERFERTLTGGARAEYVEIEVPEFRIDDATLIEENHDCLRALRHAATTVATGKKTEQKASVALLTKDCGAFCHCAEGIRDRIHARRTQIEEAKQMLQARAETAKHHLASRMSSGLEPTVREEVYQDVLRRLDNIDVLRYPRQLLAMPVNGIRSLLSRWWTPTAEDSPDHSSPVADPISSETFHLLESELITFADQSRNDIQNRPGLESLVDRQSFKSLRFDHQQLQALFVEHHDRFSKWVARQAEETAAEITTENKAKFVLSQVLFNTVLISSQVAMGPGYTFLDLGASGVISPMVARGISMAIGNEKVKQFETAARAEHRRSLGELVDRAAARFREHLDRSSVGLAELEQSLEEIIDSRNQIPNLIRHFQGQDRQSHDPSSSTSSSTESKE